MAHKIRTVQFWLPWPPVLLCQLLPLHLRMPAWVRWILFGAARSVYFPASCNMPVTCKWSSVSLSRVSLSTRRSYLTPGREALFKMGKKFPQWWNFFERSIENLRLNFREQHTRNFWPRSSLLHPRLRVKCELLLPGHISSTEFSPQSAANFRPVVVGT